LGGFSIALGIVPGVATAKSLKGLAQVFSPVTPWFSFGPVVGIFAALGESEH